MADESLDILIRTIGDTSGAEKVANAQAGLNSAVTSGTEAHKEASKASEKHAERLHGLHKITHALNGIFPGLGLVMQSVFSTTGASIGAVVLALHELVKVTGEYNERLKEMGKVYAEGVLGAMEEERKRADAARDALREYNEALGQAVKNVNALKEAEDQRLAKLRAILDQQRQVLAAQEAAEKAAAGGDKAKEAEVERRYGRARAKQAIDQEAAEQAERERVVKETRGELGTARERAEAAAKARAAGVPDVMMPGATKEGMQAAMAAYETAAVRAGRKTPEQLAAEAQSILTVGGEGSELRAGLLLAQAGKLEKLKNAAEQAEKTYKAAEEAERQRQEALKRLEKAEADAIEKMNRLAADVDAKQAAADSGRAVLDVHRQTYSEVEKTKAIGELASYNLPQGPRMRSILDIVNAEEARAAGVTMSKEQAELVRGLTALLQQSGNNKYDILALFKEMMDLNLSHEQKLRDIYRALNRNRQGLAGSYTPQ